MAFILFLVCFHSVIHNYSPFYAPPFSTSLTLIPGIKVPPLWAAVKEQEGTHTWPLLNLSWIDSYFALRQASCMENWYHPVPCDIFWIFLNSEMQGPLLNDYIFHWFYVNFWANFSTPHQMIVKSPILGLYLPHVGTECTPTARRIRMVRNKELSLETDSR